MTAVLGFRGRKGRENGAEWGICAGNCSSRKQWIAKLFVFSEGYGPPIAVFHSGAIHSRERNFCSQMVFRGIISMGDYSMRKLAIFISLLFVAGIASSPAALADNITLTLQNTTPSTTSFVIAGTFSSGVPSTSISLPNQNYAISFTIDTAPGSLGSFVVGQGGDAFGVDADITFAVSGLPLVTVDSVLVGFFDTLNGNDGGLAFCLPTASSCGTTNWMIGGEQLFTGSIGTPSTLAFISGSPTVNGAQSGYEISGSGPFPFGPPPSSTPEPATMLLMGTGLLGLGAFTRRKLR